MHKLEVHSKLRCSTASSLIKTSQKPLKTYPTCQNHINNNLLTYIFDNIHFSYTTCYTNDTITL